MIRWFVRLLLLVIFDLGFGCMPLLSLFHFLCLVFLFFLCYCYYCLFVVYLYLRLFSLQHSYLVIF